MTVEASEPGLLEIKASELIKVDSSIMIPGCPLREDRAQLTVEALLRTEVLRSLISQPLATLAQQNQSGWHLVQLTAQLKSRSRSCRT